MTQLELKEIISKVVAEGKEFGMAIMPGETTPMWFGDNDSDSALMDIAPWLCRFNHRITIANTTNDCEECSHMIGIPTQSTTYDDYIDAAHNVIDSCRKRRGKTVLSRVICGFMDGKRTGAIAAQLFERHPQSMRFIYYTKQTGLWLGATPELLLDFNRTDGSFRTMAFAGTRLKSDPNPWDDKNLKENAFVIDYIIESLKKLGATVKVSKLETVGYGKIEHLCAHITGKTSPDNLEKVIDAINPTPALCGWPLKKAIEDIRRNELHSRGCYGGFIGISTPERYRAFVNLRCMQFRDGKYCIYGGGGITADSKAKAEYAETEAKTEFLQKLTAEASTTSPWTADTLPEKHPYTTQPLTATSAGKRQYKLGIALSGGGARGFAHIGALKAIEEAGLKPDVIAGVSAGSIVGVLYAAGVPLNDILEMFSKAKFTDFCKLSISKGEGVFSLNKFKKFIERAAGVKNLEELKIPTYIGVTDIDNGIPAEFHEGAIGERVIASCSIPIVFQPVRIDGTHYVDGGVLRNLPAWIIRDKCEKLIGINVSPLNTFRYKKSFFEIALRTFNLMVKANQLEDMYMCDHVILTPELSAYQAYNLKDTKKAYLSGYAAAHKAIKKWLH